MDDDVRGPARDRITEHARTEIRAGLEGRRHGFALLLPFAGPAVVVSTAYLDPGNFAVNIQAGARYGFALVWVVLLSSLVAMLFQALAAKLGIVTGRNLAELCRDRLPRPLALSTWAVSEAAAMATDLAEFVGGGIGVSLLLHLPMMAGMGITAVATCGLLLLDRTGFRPLELAIGGLVAVIGVCYLAELAIQPVAWPQLFASQWPPRLADSGAVLLACGIVGSTVMPHALFLHSGLVQRRASPRTPKQRSTLLRYARIEAVVALGVAAIINMAMVIMAADAFHPGHVQEAALQSAYHTLGPLLGAAAAGVFLVALITSGISSSVVGTLAGQMVMEGFAGFRMPVWLRRAVTMIPSFVVVALGIDATRALVLSQVMLSLALPIPVAALLWFTSRRNLMGMHRNAVPTTTIAVAAAGAVVALNVVLLVQVAGGP
ncbi:MAG TPA: Nramp family divalent metal transporter [Rhodanobacteraceae bacterium]|nr:Nramp family divalent metal transporter [Rhodanobacteraceae bacterium]